LKRRHVIALAVLAGTAAVLFRPALNVAGFCWAEKRFLSDEEMFASAAKAAFEYYPPMHYRTAYAEVVSPIKYASVEDFDARNADCCKFVDSSEAVMASTHNYWRGRVRAYVKVTYRVEIDPQSGGSSSGLPPGMDNVIFTITNCGEAWNEH
jgi:hypothetical protein